MKTSELKKIVEDNGFIFVNASCNKSIFIYKNSEAHKDYRRSSFISKEYSWFGVDDELPKSVAQAILDYAYTPLEEREEQKKYRLKALLPSWQGNPLYLRNSVNIGYYLSDSIKAEFTQKEIDAMPFDTNFFIKEEVV